jgi:hypothetical protein
MSSGEARHEDLAGQQESEVKSVVGGHGTILPLNRPERQFSRFFAPTVARH